jgi:hypothetical protein
MMEGFWAGLPLGQGVTVITHDRIGLGALDKPAGVLSHPDTGLIERITTEATNSQTEVFTRSAI